jgi:hypothetical protein
VVQLIDSNDQRARMIGLRETARSVKAVHEAQAVKEKDPHPVLDIRHAEFCRDPMAVVGEICAFIELELTPMVERAMRQRIATTPPAAHGAHRYEIGHFGMTEAEIRERFGSYMDRFVLRPSRS